MKQMSSGHFTILHDRVPNRIRLSVPMLKHKRTYAELLKQSLLNNVAIKGIYHVEPSIITGSVLIKYHPAFHSKEEVLELVHTAVENISRGNILITAKHKNPRLGKMRPGAFFTRELLVSIGGNIISGIALAALIRQ